MNAKEKIAKIRQLMKEDNVSYYLVDTADPHLSEYIADYYKEREYISGFTGSNGTLLIGLSDAYLWTDGRYFVQADHELLGSDIVLMKMGQKGVPTIKDFLMNHIKEGQVLAFNGLLVSARLGNELSKIADIRPDKDYCSQIWTDRPMLNITKAFVLSDEITGKSSDIKLKELRSELIKKGAGQILISKLDDIMWLFNIRARDIECNPVSYSYAYVSSDKAILYINEEALSEQLNNYFEAIGVSIRDYKDINGLFNEFDESHILLNESSCNYYLYEGTAKLCQIVDKPSPILLAKAIKNQQEIDNSRKCYLDDSVVLTKFIKYIKEHVADNKISEIDAAHILDDMRSQIPGFIELSFPTISAYGANGAMMHYEATKDNFSYLKPEGIYLVDSGATYQNGTTDVTRSIILGPVTDKMKLHYTKALVGMLRLQNAVFMHGCTGRNLDILARGPLWEMQIDYKCGTGHGVGYILNVHEGPQAIRSFARAGSEDAVLEAGMIISDEPGVYIEGEYGIRHENILLCQKLLENEDGTFMHFEPLTYVPIDLEGIDEKAMDSHDKQLLNAYHAAVFKKLSPFMDDEERSWLEHATREI